MSGKPQNPGWELVFGDDGDRVRLKTTDPARFPTDDDALGDVIRQAFAGSVLHKQALNAVEASAVPEQRERIGRLLTGMVEYRREETLKFREGRLRDRIRDMLEAEPELREPLEEGWNRIKTRIEDRALSTPKNARRPAYEVYHEIEVARECFFLAVIDGKGPDDAEAYVRLRMSLDSDPERLIREWREGAKPEHEGMAP